MFVKIVKQRVSLCLVEEFQDVDISLSRSVVISWLDDFDELVLVSLAALFDKGRFLLLAKFSFVCAIEYFFVDTSDTTDFLEFGGASAELGGFGGFGCAGFRGGSCCAHSVEYYNGYKRVIGLVLLLLIKDKLL